MKSLAERFYHWWMLQMQNPMGSDIVDWLKAQPENTKTFTIDEVEEIVEEGSNISFTSCTMRDPKIFEDWWANKKQELEK